MFDELDALQRLFLHGNDLTTLDADVFDGLDTLARLHLDENDLGSLPAALFEDLDDSLTDLYLRDNGLVVLPTGVFAGLSGLQRLDLSCNVLTALDLDVFNPFGGTLKYLDLGANSFTTPPTEAAVNAKLTALEALYLTGGPPCLPAYDVGLSALSLSTGTLSPAFAPPGLSQYQAMVGHDVSELTITPTTRNPDAVIGPSPGGDIVTDTDPNTTGIQATLRPISTSVRWKVTAENRDTSQNTTMDYTVLVIREHPPGSVARLRSLELSGLTLAPEFGSSTYDYEAERPASATQTSVTAIPIDPDAEVAITADGGPAEADGTVDISPDTETVTVKVTAEDGVSTQTYIVRLVLSIEVSGTYLGVMYLEELTGLPTSSDSDSYVRGNRSVNGLWSDGTTLWVADGHSNQARFHQLDCPGGDGCGVPMGPDVPSGSQFTEDGKKIHHDTIQALTAYDLGGGYRVPALDMANTSYLVYDDLDTASGCSGTDRSAADPGGGGACDGLVGPEGVWSDGDVVWVSDRSRVVKAYRLTSFTEKSGPDATAQLLPDRSLTLPVRSVPRGIWSDGTTIWVVDAFRDERAGVNRRPKLVAFDLHDGTRNSGRDITGLHGYPDGVWSDGVTLWVSTSVRSGPDNDKVGRDKVLAYEFSPEGGEAVRDEDRDLRLRNHRHATGLWSDGEQMWVGDGGPAVHVYCLDRAASCHGAQKRSTDATIALPYPSGNFDLSSDNANPGATWSDDTTLWALDATDKKIYAYALSDGTADTTSLSLATNNADPAGMWSDGTTIWVSDSADYKLYAYTMDPWERDGGSDFSLTGLNAAARSLGGVWSNGAGTIWVAHRLIDGPGQATAFNTGDGSMDNDRTFDLSALNSNPAGMWSDGRTMWVLDTGADKVFAYDLDTGQSLPHRDVDALIARFEQISDNTPTSVVGIGSPTGFHVSESGSGGPSRWPRSLPPECFETHAETDADGKIVEPDPPIAPMPPCDRPYGRMMWVVDGQNNKVHAIRLHPALFEAPAAESVTAGSGNRSAPPPPDNVRAVTQKSGAVALDWQSPDGATVTGYRIERRRAGEGLRDNHVLVEDTGSADTGYTDKSAEEGVDYEYRVSSRNEDGPGEVSDWVRAVPEEEPVFGDGPPGAPRNLTAAAGDQEITLSWEPPADNGNPPATRYRIEWRMDGKDYKKGHWGTSGSTTYTKTDLANGVKYVFRVKAENGSGNSYGPYGLASEEVSATPTSGSAVDLGTPVLSNTKTLHHGMVQLDWEDIEDAGWYVVQYYHVKSGEWLGLPAAGVDIAFHGSSAVVSDLHGLSWLRIRAMSCAGESEWSQIEELYGTKESDWEDVPVPEVAEGDQIDPCPVILGTPVLSNTKTLHHGMVQLDWEDIEDAGWYVVQYYHVKSGEWLDLPAAGVDSAFHGSSAVVSDLHGLSWLRVRAMSCAGESEWSQIEELYGTNASDWEGVPVPEVAEGDEIEPCSEEVATPDNSPATGEPAITGTVQVGETLTANTSGIADPDGLSNVQYEYQWLADDAEIAGATNATYTLVAEDEGKAIKVRVSFTDDAGNEETLTSAATAAVAAAPTPNSPATGAPTISGTAQVGETLTANTSGVIDADGLSNVQYEYQWLADDAEIAGASNSTYTLPDSEENKAIKVEVSFTDDAGNGETLTSAATAAVTAELAHNNPATGALAVTGAAQVGETLTAHSFGIEDADGLTNAVFSYQWVRNDGSSNIDITGATGSTYTLEEADEGKTIQVRVSFTDDEGNAETLTSAATDSVSAASTPNTPATGTPTISGMAQVGEMLEAHTSGIADKDGLTNAVFTYQWLADDAAIAGATGSTYTLIEADEGKSIKVQVSFPDDAGNEESLTSAATATVSTAPNSNSPATGTPTISGTAQVGETLTADTSSIADADGMEDDVLAFLWWVKNNETEWSRVRLVEYEGTYRIEPRDVGKTITVMVRFSDDQDNMEYLESTPTDTVEAAPNTAASGQPTIIGIVRAGETLTVDTSGIADENGLENATFAYQWLADQAEIPRATGSTYYLSASDESKSITLRVSFTDDGGNHETVISPAVSATTTLGEPRNLELTPVAVGTNSVGIKVSWDPPFATGGSDVSGYRVQWKGYNQDYPNPYQPRTRQAYVENAPFTIDRASHSPGDELTVRVAAANGVWAEKIRRVPQSHTDLELWLLMKEYADEKQTTFPWVLETWNYMDEYKVAVEVNPNFGSSHHGRPCVDSYTDGDDGLQVCHTEKIKIRQIDDPNSHAIIHEMAHAYTLANRVTDTPGPLAIAHLYFKSLGLGCDAPELYADVLTLLTLGSSYSSYWEREQ